MTPAATGFNFASIDTETDGNDERYRPISGIVTSSSFDINFEADDDAAPLVTPIPKHKINPISPLIPVVLPRKVTTRSRQTPRKNNERPAVRFRRRYQPQLRDDDNENNLLTENLPAPPPTPPVDDEALTEKNISPLYREEDENIEQTRIQPVEKSSWLQKFTQWGESFRGWHLPRFSLRGIFRRRDKTNNDVKILADDLFTATETQVIAEVAELDADVEHFSANNIVDLPDLDAFDKSEDKVDDLVGALLTETMPADTTINRLPEVSKKTPPSKEKDDFDEWNLSDNELHLEDLADFDVLGEMDKAQKKKSAPAKKIIANAVVTDDEWATSLTGNAPANNEWATMPADENVVTANDEWQTIAGGENPATTDDEWKTIPSSKKSATANDEWETFSAGEVNNDEGNDEWKTFSVGEKTVNDDEWNSIVGGGNATVAGDDWGETPDDDFAIKPVKTPKNNDDACTDDDENIDNEANDTELNIDTDVSSALAANDWSTPIEDLPPMSAMANETSDWDTAVPLGNAATTAGDNDWNTAVPLGDNEMSMAANTASTDGDNAWAVNDSPLVDDDAEADDDIFSAGSKQKKTASAPIADDENNDHEDSMMPPAVLAIMGLLGRIIYLIKSAPSKIINKILRRKKTAPPTTEKEDASAVKTKTPTDENSADANTKTGEWETNVKIGATGATSATAAKTPALPPPSATPANDWKTSATDWNSPADNATATAQTMIESDDPDAVVLSADNALTDIDGIFDINNLPEEAAGDNAVANSASQLNALVNGVKHWARLLYEYLDKIINFKKNWWLLVDGVSIIIMTVAFATITAYFLYYQ